MSRRYLLLIALVLSGVSFSLSAQNLPPGAPVQAGKIKVACVGNSITFGYGIKNRDSLSYPADLQRMMGNKYDVRNFGVSGRTLLKKGDHPYWKEKAFQQVQQWKPDVVVILLGTNDTKPWNWKYGDEFGADYTNLLEVFKKLPSHPEIWAALPVPVFKHNKYGIRDSVVKVEIPIIRKVARTEDVHIMNLYRALRPYGNDFFDGVHPDKTGAHYLAKAVYKQIRHHKRL
ncbi:MAG TPA: GDSL-type esterase/lipase family protein [Chitinophagaceae bacterium]|nr:GDSL-type esterase/lipase family protein [Chitinophagaceae bacterium]